jgi:hypothetical protein
MSKHYKLPNFVHFGTPKSGSATISHVLSRHPEVYTPRPKELNFFNSVNYARGCDWYAETYFADQAGQPIVCDKSIGYSTGDPDQTMERIVGALGSNFKILLTVRQPVDRAYSHYCMARYKAQIEKFDFTSAVRSALQVDGQFSKEDLYRAVDERGYYRDATSMAIFRNSMYLVPGCYSRLLNICHSAVGKDNVRVILTEDMSADLPAALRDLTDFLGIEPVLIKNGFRQNEATALRFPWLRRFYNKLYSFPSVRLFYNSLGISARKSLRRKMLSWNYQPNDSVPPAEPEGCLLLQDYYSSDIEVFQRMIGRDLSHWFKRYETM